MTNLRVLHVEDSAADAFLVRQVLNHGGFSPDIVQVSSYAEYVSALRQGSHDVILLDNALPGFGSHGALRLAQRHSPDTPLIIVSGHADAAGVLGSLEAGASDYVVKSQPWQLVVALRRIFAARKAAPSGAPEQRPRENQRVPRSLANALIALSQAADLPVIAAVASAATRELTGADGAVFIHRDGDLCHYIAEDATNPLWKGQRIAQSACLGSWVWQHGEVAVIDDVPADPRVPTRMSEATAVKSLVMVPVGSGGAIAIIGGYWTTPHRASALEVDFLQLLARAAAVAMERVRTHEELTNRVDLRTTQLLDVNRELDAFSSSVSHDLLTPVRTVDSYARMLMDKTRPGLDDEDRFYLEHVAHAAEKMQRLIEDQLRLARFARSDLKRERADLSAMAVELAARLQDREPERRVEFRIRPGLCVEGDAGLLLVVMENLLDNAWKFCAAQKRAVITFDSQTARDGSEAFYVRDNGIGFDMEQAGRLFSPFQRVHRTQDFSGHGIGLATARRIIHRHGGRIWADAAVGKGATFAFTVPRAQAVREPVPAFSRSFTG